MIRARFKSHSEDYRPINFPPKHPWWATGYSEDADGELTYIVTYADDEAYILENWPEAKDIDVFQEELTEYTFTDRFAKPDWFQPEVTP
jgi:hypothetical protein